jgi:hypothetical protein
MRIVSAPVACFYDVYVLLRLLEEERVADARIPRLFYDANEITIIHNKFSAI